MKPLLNLLSFCEAGETEFWRSYMPISVYYSFFVGATKDTILYYPIISLGQAIGEGVSPPGIGFCLRDGSRNPVAEHSPVYGFLSWVKTA